MKLTYRYIPSALLLSASLISLWFFFCNLQKLQPAIATFSVLVITGTVLALSLYKTSILILAKKRISGLMRHKHSTKVCLAFILITGIAARLFFRFRFSYEPVSDPMTFYNSAKELASGAGQIGNSYVAFQPYLSGYNNILGLAMKFISDPWLATILLNTLLDIFASFALYFLMKRITKPSTILPLAANAIWVLSPLNIIFSVLSLPIIVVNLFVILTLLVSHFFLESTKQLRIKKSIVSSAVLGLVLGIGNCFRPIFIVPIIALVMMVFYLFFEEGRNYVYLKLSLSCILLVSFIFFAIQAMNVSFVSNQTGLSAAKNPSGWSMYVGSSWESKGQWRPYHNDERRQICKSSLEQKNFDECHKLLRDNAIERYKSHGPVDLIGLMVDKLYHQSEEQSYFYNAEFSIVGYTSSKTFIVINAYMTIFMFILFFYSAKSLYVLARKAKLSEVEPILLIAVLMLIGWFVSFVLVESAPRYSTILYPMFIIFVVLGIDINNKKATLITAP